MKNSCAILETNDVLKKSKTSDVGKRPAKNRMNQKGKHQYVTKKLARTYQATKA